MITKERMVLWGVILGLLFGWLSLAIAVRSLGH